MSFLKSKHNGWLSDGTRTPFTGGGGGGPSQTTTQTSNIPEYARPYVENMLGATQAQLFNTTTDPETGERQITGFKPYQPYSSNVSDYFAGYSPLQTQAFGEIGSMGTPGQFGMGTDLAAQGGRNLMGTAAPAMEYGAQGAGYGGLGAAASQMGFGAGQAFENKATSPGDVARYMSPYMQNVVDYQKSQALRDFQIGQPMMAAKAVGQGAFGGNRLALQQSEAQRGLMSQLQGIQASGTQKAFEDAQRQQQFGAQLGLQGLGAGYQGLGLGIQGAQAGLQGVQGAQAGYQGAVGAGGTLGNIGAQQSQSDLARIALMAQLGGQMQGFEQGKVNQSISDYATQQQYPMLQLGLMSNMLRGLPMQAQTTQLYQAQPSVLQQGIGALGAAGSLYGAGAFGRKEGGTVKMAEGGIAGYKYGGAIAEPKLESMADSLSIAQLQQRIKDPALTPGERQVFQEALAAKQQTMARSEGIAAAGGGLFNTMGYAGGGILAFADEGLVEDKERSAFQQDLIDTFGYSGAKGERPEVPEYMKKIGRYFTKPREKTTLTPAQLDAMAAKQGVFAEGSPALSEGMPTPTPATTPAAPSTGSQAARAPSAQAGEPSDISSILAGLRKEGPQGELGSGYLDKLKGLEAGADKRMDKAASLAAARAFAKFGSTATPGGIGQAALLGLGDYAEGYGKAIESDEKFRLENAKLQSDIENLRRAEERGDVKLASDIQSKIKDRQLKLAEMQNQLKIAGIQASRASEFERQYEAFKANPKQFEQFKKSLTSQDDTARLNALVKADEFISKAYPNLVFSNKPEDKIKLDKIRTDKVAEYLGAIKGASAAPAGGSGNLVQNKDGSFNYVPR